MARVEASVFISRPVDEVFAFVADLQHGAMWQAGFVEYRPLSEGPIRVGTKFQDVREFLGRRIVSAAEVIAYEADREFGIKVAFGPVPFSARFDFEPIDGGTRITVFAEGEPGWFFRFLEPLVAIAFRKRLGENFATLKGVLESPFWKLPGRA